MTLLGTIHKAMSILPTLMRVHSAVASVDVVDSVLSSPVIAPMQIRSELLRFAEIISELCPKMVMEIGTCRGGTLCVLSRLSDAAATIISVDMPHGEFGGGYRPFRIPIYKSFATGRQKIHLIRGDSHSIDVEGQVRDIIGKSGKLDLLFIDGDHTYNGVKQDWLSYSSLVRHGGIVAFHDIVEHPGMVCQVRRCWQEIKNGYRHEEIIESESQAWAGIGVLYV